MDFDWKGVVRTVAPGLASLFGGPLGGAATKFLVDGLLGPDVHPDQHEEALATALRSATPEMLLKMKELDQQWAIETEKLKLEHHKLDSQDKQTEVADRDGARKLAAVDTEHVAARLSFFIAGAFSMTCVAVIALYVWRPDADPSAFVAGLIGTIVGAIISEMKQMTAFHFGKNSTTARTQEMLFQSQPVEKFDEKLSGKP